MSTNHLIIGWGGTGGKIIRALGKTLFQEYRVRRLERVSLGYLNVDSSQEMIVSDGFIRTISPASRIASTYPTHLRVAIFSPTKTPTDSPWMWTAIFQALQPIFSIRRSWPALLWAGPGWTVSSPAGTAKIVGGQFSSRGVLAGVSTGFGSAVPAASNATDDGREKNRRVEVWLK
jgi:hypothetical protein